jgi:glycosyltransferase involved in cell wall biosynthesis
MNGASGGAAESTRDLIAELSTRGVESSAVCDMSGSPEDFAKLKDAVDGRLIATRLVWWNKKTRSPLWKRPIHAFLQWLRTGRGRGSARVVATVAGHFNADLIHTNTLLNPEGGIAARALGLKHVWHVRELTGPGKPFRFSHEGQSLAALMHDWADTVACNSQATADCLQAGPDAGGFIRVIHNGIDVARFANRTRKWGDGAVTVGMVGSLESLAKNHALFIDAAAAVSNAAVRFVIFGSGTHENRALEDGYVRGLRALAARRGLGDRLTFAGHTTPPAIYNAIDLLAHPADGESFGRIGVEAMASGIAAVVPDRGGLAEIVEDGVSGVHFAAGDARAMAAAIDRLVADPARAATLGANGKRIANERFTRERYASAVLAIYRELLGDPAIPGAPQ